MNIDLISKDLKSKTKFALELAETELEAFYKRYGYRNSNTLMIIKETLKELENE